MYTKLGKFLSIDLLHKPRDKAQSSLWGYARALILLNVMSFAHANDQKLLVYFNFEKLSVAAKGVYTPSAEGKHTVDNIQAEVLARTNGINHIVKYLNASCSETNAKFIGLQPKFDTMFRSQGTEIYSDGALSVNLVAPYKSIFKSSDAQKLRTESGENLVFSLPSAIPANALKCGTPTFEFSNRSNEFVRIQMIPAKIQNQINPEEKIIKLIFDEKKKVLVIANPSDSPLLKDINGAPEPNSIKFLPVTIYAQSVFK